MPARRGHKHKAPFCLVSSQTGPPGGLISPTRQHHLRPGHPSRRPPSSPSPARPTTALALFVIALGRAATAASPLIELTRAYRSRPTTSSPQSTRQVWQTARDPSQPALHACQVRGVSLRRLLSPARAKAIQPSPFLAASRGCTDGPGDAHPSALSALNPVQCPGPDRSRAISNTRGTEGPPPAKHKF